MAQHFDDFGQWLSFNEAIKSATALRKGIDNMPTQAIYNNMVKVYNDFYAPACEHFKLKLPVNSFYRCPALNKAVGGASNSAHMYGCAIDIDCDSISKPSNQELLAYFRANYNFDQLIGEAPDLHNNYSWVHIANNRDGQSNRQQVMKMIWQKGKQVYEYI